MKYRANFYDKNGDETRSLIVQNAIDENDAENQALTEADVRKWPLNFRLADVEEIE